LKKSQTKGFQLLLITAANHVLNETKATKQKGNKKKIVSMFSVPGQLQSCLTVLMLLFLLRSCFSVLVLPFFSLFSFVGSW